MAWLERICDAALSAVDRLHIFRRSQLDEWHDTQRDAEDAVSKLREQNARDIEHMSPDEKARLPNRLEEIYLGRNGGRHG